VLVDAHESGLIGRILERAASLEASLREVR